MPAPGTADKKSAGLFPYLEQTGRFSRTGWFCLLESVAGFKEIEDAGYQDIETVVVDGFTAVVGRA